MFVTIGITMHPTSNLSAATSTIKPADRIIYKHNSSRNPAIPAQETSTTITQIPSTTSTSTTTTIPIPSEPGGGTTLFPGKRIVAFYGAPNGGSLGVLGDAPPQTMWPKLIKQANQYQQPGVQILPAYELITYVAQGSPQPDGTYSKRLSNSEIQQYLDVVKAHNGMLILDIQPGRGNFLNDAKTLTAFLDQPDVGLALDPEWQVDSTHIPGQVIGNTTAAEINQVSAWLQQLTTINHLPQKLLLIHQFNSEMVQDKQAVQGEPNLAIVFNMDGFGTWKAKLNSYKMLAADNKFQLGFKLFYRQDVPLENPPSVLALSPVPVVIEYE